MPCYPVFSCLRYAVGGVKGSDCNGLKPPAQEVIEGGGGVTTRNTWLR